MRRQVIDSGTGAILSDNIDTIDVQDARDFKKEEVRQKASRLIRELSGAVDDNNFRILRAEQRSALRRATSQEQQEDLVLSLYRKIDNVRRKSDDIEEEIDLLSDVSAVFDFNVEEAFSSPRLAADDVFVELSSTAFLRHAAASLGTPNRFAEILTDFQISQDHLVRYALEEYRRASSFTPQPTSDLLFIGVANGLLAQDEADAIIDNWPRTSA